MLSGSGLDLVRLSEPGFTPNVFKGVRLTWGHRVQTSWDTKARSGILGTRSRAGPCKAWDWLVSAVWAGSLLVHCGGCSRALGSGMLGNAAGNWAQ